MVGHSAAVFAESFPVRHSRSGRDRVGRPARWSLAVRENHPRDLKCASARCALTGVRRLGHFRAARSERRTLASLVGLQVDCPQGLVDTSRLKLVSELPAKLSVTNCWSAPSRPV